MNNLKKFQTQAEYTAATLYYPAVSWVVEGDYVYFDKSAPTPTFSGLTVYYNITSTSQPTELFNGGGGSGSGSGSGSGGALPSAMIIDGTEVEVAATYQFDTVGEHIVNYSFADNQIPKDFMFVDGDKFSTVTKVEIGDAITSIGNYAFYDCSSLTTCTIGNGVTNIGNYAFYNCISLTSVTIGSGVTTIGDSAFSVCSGLTSIDIPNSVTSIGEEAFIDCSGATSVTIGSGVTSIGNSAFADCTSLTSISSNAITAPTLGNSVFVGVKNNGTLRVPSGSQGYCGWMAGAELPSYWTIEGVTCE